MRPCDRPLPPPSSSPPSSSSSCWSAPLRSTAAATSGAEMWNSIFFCPAGSGCSNTSDGCSAGPLRTEDTISGGRLDKCYTPRDSTVSLSTTGEIVAAAFHSVRMPAGGLAGTLPVTPWDARRPDRATAGGVQVPTQRERVCCKETRRLTAAVRFVHLTTISIKLLQFGSLQL